MIGQLIAAGVPPSDIYALVSSDKNVNALKELGVNILKSNLDTDELTYAEIGSIHGAFLYYLVPPPKHGLIDSRSQRFIEHLEPFHFAPSKVVLISTTGVYGDQQGEWVDETSRIQANTDRAKRRIDSEKRWTDWAQHLPGQQSSKPPLIILRVPGIYAYSRLPRARLESGAPVVSPEQCGFSNRIHADDLASAMLTTMREVDSSEVFNASDGVPGKISEFLQAAANALQLPPLNEISWSQAQQELSQGMLSYLSESRKIDNRKLLRQTSFKPKYIDYKQGILTG